MTSGLHPRCRPVAMGTVSGFGTTEAPRGALGHWVTVENGVVKNYQMVVCDDVERLTSRRLRKPWSLGDRSDG